MGVVENNKQKQKYQTAFVAISRGYIFIAIATLCLIILLTFTIIHGGHHVGSITTDPTHPGIGSGDYFYMPEEAFARYYLFSKTVGAIGFISAIVGIFLFLKSKNNPT